MSPENEKSGSRPTFASKRDGAYNNLLIYEAFYWQFCKGDFDRAIAVLDDAVRIFPRDPAAYNERSQVYSEKGDYNAALSDINRALTLVNNDPYRASTYNGRAGILKQMGQLEKSIADYDAVFAPLRARRQANSGKQPGDPVKAARAILTLVASVGLWLGAGYGVVKALI